MIRDDRRTSTTLFESAESAPFGHPVGTTVGPSVVGPPFRPAVPRRAGQSAFPVALAIAFGAGAALTPNGALGTTDPEPRDFAPTSWSTSQGGTTSPQHVDLDTSIRTDADPAGRNPREPLSDPRLPVARRLDLLYEHIGRLEGADAGLDDAARCDELARAWSELRLLQRTEFGPLRARFEREVLAPLDRALDTIHRARKFLGRDGRPPAED